MRNWIAVILLVPMCLLSMSGLIGQPDSADILEEQTEATALETEETARETESTTEETMVPEITEPSTEPVLEDTEPPTSEPYYEYEQEQYAVSLGVFRLTAYCSCEKCCDEYALNRPVDENGDVIVYGSIGVRLKAGVSIAVDPSVIPYGTRVKINGHTYIAQDTGGAIVGNRIDVYFEDHQDALNFGVQYAEVFSNG